MKIIWRRHDTDHVRLWRDDWFGDQFEVVTNDEAQAFQYMCQRLSIPFTEAEDD